MFIRYSVERLCNFCLVNLGHVAERRFLGQLHLSLEVTVNVRLRRIVSTVDANDDPGVVPDQTVLTLLTVTCLFHLGQVVHLELVATEGLISQDGVDYI